MRSKLFKRQKACRAGGEGYPAGDPAALVQGGDKAGHKNAGILLSIAELCRKASALKECVAYLTFENRLLKKAFSRMGATKDEVIPRPKSSRSSGSSSSHICRPGARGSNWALRAGPSAAGMTVTSRAGRRRWRIDRPPRAACGTVSRPTSMARSSSWRWGITSPAYVVIKAANRFHTQTTRPNEMWRTDFTYFKIIGWGCLGFGMIGEIVATRSATV